MLVRIAILFFILSAASGLIHVPQVSAQYPKLETSADEFNFKFFGESVLQVVIRDENADASGVVEDIIVSIKADPETGSGGTSSFAIPETSGSSSRFEFYLMHVDANDVQADEIDPINTAGVEGAAGAGSTAAPIITFGPSVAGADLTVEGAEGMYEEISFQIAAGDTQIKVDYEESIAGLTLDRNSYPSNAFVYVSVHDNDANLNPTAPDEFSVSPSTAPNNDLFLLDGGVIAQATVFKETGDNTGIFKARYQLGSSITTASKSLVMTLNDKANYGASLNATENDSNHTVGVSFTVGDDTSGTVDIDRDQTAPVKTYDPIFSADTSDGYRAGETVEIQITDPDANTNTNTVDMIHVDVKALAANRNKEITAIETGVNTGIFALSFSLSHDNDGENSIIVQDGDAVAVEYMDLHPANNASARKFSIQIQVIPRMADPEKVTPLPPVLKDITGKTLSSISVGKQAIISATLKNNNDQPQSFVALVEVRDPYGITVFLEWQTGMLNSRGEAEIGLSWIPENSGSYKVRTFIINTLQAPEVLSPISESFVTVS